MVIEGPDRFGLAQLHQLRGRTGRGQEQAWCFLLLPQGCPEETETRLRTFANTEDGFALAELDLSQRGAGHLDGTVQSGFGSLRYADLVKDKDLVNQARNWVSQAPG
jgi:ATP-dependent DNA helicase RecG